MLKQLSLAAMAATALTFPATAEARNQMRAVGSSTVFPFAKQVAERVARANPSLGTPIIESTGTGAGMKLFCAGVGERFPDVENASRRMKASEAKQCQQNGVTSITEIQVGIDGISFATAKNSPLRNLTQRDLYLAVAKTPFGKPNRARTWKDVNASLPAIPIRVYGPPPTSGTRDALGELILTPPCEASPSMTALKKADENKFKAVCIGLREDGAYVEAGENDNLIVQKIEANGHRRHLRLLLSRGESGPPARYRHQWCGSDLRYDRKLQISRRAAALHLHQERACRRHPGGACLRRGIHEGERVRPERLSPARRPDRCAERSTGARATACPSAPTAQSCKPEVAQGQPVDDLGPVPMAGSTGPREEAGERERR